MPVTDINEFVNLIQKDIKNISHIKDFEQLFIRYNLKTELIELYKMDFLYNSNPLSFEKIGDIYCDNNDYDDALDAYLNCAEIVENYSQIFLKLAKVFDKLNDIDSKNACLEQAKMIGENNG